MENAKKCLDEIYGIYLEAFPEIERRTYEGQLAAVSKPEYRLLTRREGKKVAAFLGYWELENCVFIEHLATDRQLRGKGVGRELILECVKEAKKPVFLEIEPVTDRDPMTGRRASFYERIGFLCNRFPYVQLPLKEGDLPCPLWVMSYGRTFTEEAFAPFKNEIYRAVYGQM